MAPSVAPPTPQEIQRKLSVHSATRVKPSTTSSLGGPSSINSAGAPGTSWGTTGAGGGLISGTESDSDSILTPDISSTHAGFNLASTSIMQPPLSSIAERSPGSGGEDSDEEDDDAAGWRVASEGARAGGSVPGTTRAADIALKSGYLSKKGERRKTWKKRWFVLRPNHLAFYKNEAEYKLLRLLDLNDVHSCIPVQLKRHANVFGLILPKRTYYLQASSAQDVQDWVEAIEDARQTLMATSTQTSGNNGSAPIPIPHTPTGANLSTRPPPISVSPQQRNPNTFTQIVSSSDSEDATSQLAPPPPIGGSSLGGGAGGGAGGTGDRGGGGLVAPSPTNVTFSVSPTANKPQVMPSPASPGPKDVSTSSKVILSGYLMKCGSKRRNWRKRWFVLTSEKLVYSRSHMDTKPHRVFSLSDILDAMDYDLPKHRFHGGHHHHAPAGLTPSLSTSSPPKQTSSATGGSEGALGTSVGTTSSLAAGPVPSTPVDTETQQGGRNFTFKIVMTKKHLLLCAPSEEDEIKWLGAVRALIARRSVGGQQQQLPALSNIGQLGNESIAGVAGGSGGGGGGGGGIKSKVRRLSAGAGVLGKSSNTSAAGTTSMPSGTTVIGGGGAAGTGTAASGGDETHDLH
ncbi:hypothetical protein NP233_g7808 [Leucocoprinus birnbaumii]|uniref:PH domain-containing protein n=1 Tax=Leucocoprinus birnbaumii TaxID=56174 RepID=A0AAD5YUD8_9AGAR|nr:hypothetical protein NP233_g7808 [Leucocoprinus birnbaumii]